MIAIARSFRAAALPEPGEHRRAPSPAQDRFEPSSALGQGGYPRARRRILDWVAGEPRRVSALGDYRLKPGNRSLAFIHQEPTRPPRPTVILHHGFSAGTLQWNTPPRRIEAPAPTDRYAELLFERGFNVLVPRAPGHGLVRKDGTDETRFVPKASASPKAWHGFIDETVDLARGLGGPILVAGLSGGGNLALLSAIRHREVKGAVALAPMLRSGRSSWLFHLASALPLMDRLLDSVQVTMEGAKREALTGGRPFGFYRPYAGSALALHELGTEILSSPEHLAGKKLLLLSSEKDGVIDHRAIARLVDDARASGAKIQNLTLPGDAHPILSSLENPSPKSLGELGAALDGFFASFAPERGVSKK